MQFKYITGDVMVSTPEGFTNNSPIYSMTPTPVKKPSDRKALCLFTNILDVKNKTASVELELLNQSSNKLNQELHHGH